MKLFSILFLGLLSYIQFEVIYSFSPLLASPEESRLALRTDIYKSTEFINHARKEYTERSLACFTRLFQSQRNDIDSLALDESKLSAQERERIKNLRKEYGLSGMFDDEKEEGRNGLNDGSGATTKSFSSSVENSEKERKDQKVTQKLSTEPVEWQEDEDIEILDTDWSGQAGLDVMYIGDKRWSDITSRPLLYLGDMTALLLFAAIGRASHGNALQIFAPETIKTALPFLATWTILSPLVGAYTLDATSITDKKKVAVALLSSWFVSVPLAIAERGLLKGEIPPTPFIIVSLISTLVMTGGWRTFYMVLYNNKARQEELRTGNRKAGIFDNVKMVLTLINRW